MPDRYRRNLLAAGASAGLGCFAGFPRVASAQASASTLNIALFPEPNALIVGAGSTGPAQTVIGSIYDGLLRYDQRLRPMGNLAVDWSVSADALVYTFRLKPGVTWHDGRPFTAIDVVFTADKLLRTLNPRVRVAMASVQSVKALDPLTVEFRLHTPYAAFMQILDASTLPIAPRHLLESADLSKPLTGTPVGTGPFMFKDWQRGSSIHLAKNPNYHAAGWPKVDHVVWHIIPDAAARARAFESGKVDVLPGGAVEFSEVARLAKLPGAAVTTRGFEKLSPTCWAWINHRTDYLQDVHVRRALLHAVNREELARTVWQGFAKASRGPFNRQTAFQSDVVRSYPYDPVIARKLLAGSAYKGQSVRLMPLPFGDTWTRMAEFVRGNLQQVGFNVELVNVDLPAAIAKASSWDFDLAFTYIFQLADPALGVARNYVSSEIRKGSPFNNVGGYHNANVDALFDRGSREVDLIKRAEIYASVQRALMEDAAALWLLDLQFPTVYRSKIENLVNTSLGLIDSLGQVIIR